MKYIIILLLLIVLTGCHRLSEGEKEKFKDAIINNDKAYIEYIVSKGVDLNCEEEFGYLPLHIATRVNNIELIEYFLQHGADINSVNAWKQNCLFFTYNINTTKYLIEHGANVNQVDIWGIIPLFQAAINYELAKLYIENGSNVYHKSEHGITLLFVALKENNFRLIKYLINEKGFSANEVNHEHGINCLMWYIFCRRHKKDWDIDIIKFLIEKGVDINYNNQGFTALHYAVKFNYGKQIVKLLLDNGADANIKNNKGQTPLDIAIEKGNKEIINLLKRYSRKQ